MNQSQGGNPFGRLVEFARPHKTGYIVSVVLAVLGVAFGIVPYFATARMTIELLSGNRDLSFYMVWCLISGGCFVLKAILMGISTRASHEATFEVLSEARRKIASKLTRVPMGYILNTPSGQLKNGMVERIEQLEVPLAHVIPEMTSNLLVPIAIIVYLFVLDWRMALVSLITIPVGMMCYMGMMKEYPKKYGEVVKAGNHMSATTVEYIGGIEVIKAFNQADNSYQKFTDAVHANADLILDWMKDTQKYSAIMMSVWPAALISVLPVGCLFYMSGSLSAATFITVTVLSLGIAGPLVAAMFFTDDIAKIGTVMGEIDGILNQPELVRPEEKCDLQNLDISLENVHFAYEEEPMKIHASGEDYLEAVLVLQKNHGSVRSIDVARRVGVSKASVSYAVSALREGGFLTVDSDYVLHLTETGRNVAEKIYERHQFFTEQFIAAGVDPEIAERDACRIEHAISQDTFEKIRDAHKQEK